MRNTVVCCHEAIPWQLQEEILLLYQVEVYRDVQLVDMIRTGWTYLGISASKIDMLNVELSCSCDLQVTVLLSVLLPPSRLVFWECHWPEWLILLFFPYILLRFNALVVINHDLDFWKTDIYHLHPTQMWGALGRGDTGVEFAYMSLEFSWRELMNPWKGCVLVLQRGGGRGRWFVRLGARWKKAFTLPSYCSAVRNI